MVKRGAEHMKHAEITPEARMQYRQDAHSRQAEIERALAQARTSQGEEPWRYEIGVQSVVDALRDFSFPTTRKDITACAGARQVRLRKDFDAPLGEVLRKVGGDRYESLSHLQTVVQKNWDAVRSLERAQRRDAPP